MKPVKQVIVMRKDLNMRRGKEIAQGSHASQAWILQRLKMEYYDDGDPRISGAETGGISLDAAEARWLLDGHTKVCVRVDSEAELMEIFHAAKAAKLSVHVITDAGKTEFDGVPTRTCLAIGPDLAEDIDKITGHLKLY